MLKPTRVNLLGSAIQVLDKETNEIVGGFVIPHRGKPGAFTTRVVRAMAEQGYEIATMPSIAGNGALAIRVG